MTLHTHRSIAYVKAIGDRGRTWKLDPITNQFRFIVRMAYACHERNVPYDLTWDRHESAMRATITATGNIPMPKPLPKPPKLKIVSDWKPAIWDAAYRLDAYHDGTLNRMRPGFVIEHSCGLSLVHPSESGELGVTEHGADEDIRQGWLSHAHGIGQGLRPDAQFQTCDGCATARRDLRSRLDSRHGRTRNQSRVPAGRLQRAGGILQRF